VRGCYYVAYPNITDIVLWNFTLTDVIKHGLEKYDLAHKFLLKEI
jgi:hypothetical protein